MDKQKKIEFFKNQIDDVKRFGFEMLDTQEFQEWKDDTETLIRNVFQNDNGLHIKKFRSIRYRPGLDINDISEIEDKTAFREGIKKVKLLLGSFIKEIENFWENDGKPRKNDLIEPNIYLHLKDNVWNLMKDDFGISKKSFGKKINFIKEKYKRKIIFRDIEHSYILSKISFAKPSIILSGGIIEELLREYLLFKGISLSNNTFDYYIQTCINNGLFRKPISHLSNSARYFRNIVHMENEKSQKDTIIKATANGLVSFIFTIINDF